MYCESCKRIIDSDRCPVCKSRRVRELRTDDLCFLTEQDYLYSGILEDMLKQDGIPFLRKEVLGAGLAIKVGPMLDRSRFYVMADMMDRATAVVNELTAAEETETDGGEE